MSTGTLHLHGSRTGTPRSRLDLDRGPDFLTDPNRACSPVNLMWRSVGPEVFYSAADTVQALAKRICRTCPFQAECLDYALDRGEKFGVWSGVNMGSVSERQTARARRGKTAPAPRKPGPKTDTKPTACKVGRAEQIAGNEQRVRALWEQNLPDQTIGLRLGLSPGGVASIRRRLGLAALYGPGGNRVEQVSA